MTTMAGSPHPENRRGTPRVNLGDRVRAHACDLAQDVIVRDLSLGGFLIESGEAFPLDALHQFRIAGPNQEWTTLLTAKSVHGRCVRDADGSPRYLTGFAFYFPQGLEALARVSELVEQATSVVTF